MKLLASEPEDIKLNMTSMIDIVFQLLVFFIMTFKVVAMEGDFSVKMPLAALDSQMSMEEELPQLISVRLMAGESGGIANIFVDDNPLAVDDLFGNLTREVELRLANEGNAEREAETEVEFDIDWNLKYAYTVKAIESVSGKIEPDGTVKKLIQKIKFKDKKRPDSSL